MSETSVVARRDWNIALGITLFAAVVRTWDLNIPSVPLLDEFWYARDGCFYWRRSAEACGLAGLAAPDRDVATWLARYAELTPEHPPLAKWLIGAPMALLHYGAGPSRLSPLVAGVLTVLLLYLLVRLAFGSTSIAAGASLGLALDFPHFIHSRLAMLDVFTALFAVGAFLFLVLDRKKVEQGATGGRRWWRVLAAVSAGCATATKLSGAAVVAAVLVLLWLWSRAESRRAPGAPGWSLAQFARGALVIVAVAAATYVATYSGRLDGTLLAFPWADNAWPRVWWDRQVEMAALQAAKPTGISHPWDLPMLAPPLVYFLEETPAGVREVLLFGNPIMWWGGFLAAGIACADWVARRRKLPCELVVTAFLAGLAGWLSLTVTGRTVHLYHAVSATPFLYLALAYLAARVWSRRALRAAALAILLSAVGGFAYYLPILNAHPLSRDAWRPRGCSAISLWLSQIEACGLDSSTQSKSSRQ